jgi:Type II secretion system (T2SS), protein E, N-terminal domain
MRIKIGDLLVKAGVITELQLKAALAEQQQWGGKLGDILVRMEFLTEEVLVRALSKQTGIPRADLTGDGDKGALSLIPAESAEEFGLVPIALKEEGRALAVAMSDPLNIHVTDHLRSLTGCRIDAQLAGASAIRHAISRWYRGEELMMGDEQSSIKIVDNSGASVVTQRRPRAAPVQSAPPPPPQQQPQNGAPRTAAVEVLRGVEETQRRSVAALKAMVELLIEKGVFSRDEYLARVKR